MKPRRVRGFLWEPNVCSWPLVAWLEKDTDLDPIRDKPAFKEIVAKAQNKQ
jgi:hypothetical protein